MRLLTIFMLLLIVASCNSGKDLAKNDSPQLLDLKIYKQQTYPGIESDLWYVMNYRVEFNLRTTVPVTFNHIVVNQDSIPVRMVMVGRLLQQENGGKTLNQDSELVSLTAERQVNRNDSEEVKQNHSPNSKPTITLIYSVNNKSQSVSIEKILQEKPVSYPSAPPAGNY